jgi:ubiquinone/menaquinone biosynthesis C-methylase UbiE
MKVPEFSEDQVAKYWDENSKLWAEHVQKGWDGYREFFNNPAFFEFLGDLRGTTVLDAGCGEGYNTRILSRRGANMFGVDISNGLIELARKEEEREPRGIQYEVASFAELSIFKSSIFDTVVSFMALMDGPHYSRAIKEIYRVLRPGGNLIFSITHPCFITKGIGWIPDGDGKRVKLTVSDYFAEMPWLEQWCFSQKSIPQDTAPFKVPRFPRTFSEYINTLISAGFLIAKIDEPRPSRQMCKKHNWLQRWRDHAALFLYIQATKPS